MPIAAGLPLRNKRRRLALDEALRKRFRTPEEALRALNIDPQLLAMDSAAALQQLRARDTEPLPSPRMNGRGEQPLQDRRRPGCDQLPGEGEAPRQNGELMRDRRMVRDQEEDLDDEDNDRRKGDLLNKILALVSPNLSAEERGEFERLLDSLIVDAGIVADEPPDFPGKPLVGGGQVPLKSRDAQLDPMRQRTNQREEPNRSPAMDAALRIKVLPSERRPVPSSLFPSAPQTSRQVQLAQDSATRASAQASFAARHPEVMRIKVL